MKFKTSLCLLVKSFIIYLQIKYNTNFTNCQTIVRKYIDTNKCSCYDVVTNKGGIYMKVLKNNKGLIIFYVCVSIVMAFWVTKVERENDKIMYEKNTYVLTNYR